MQYKDFIIKIESKQGEDYIINIRSPAGEGTSKLRLPFKLDDAAGMMQKLAGTFRGHRLPRPTQNRPARCRCRAPLQHHR
jgi:hypothetical protein